MSNQQAIEDYLEYLASIRNLSANSVESYRFDLEKFAHYLDTIKLGIFDVTHEDAKRFMAYMLREKRAKSSVNRTLSGVKGFYKHAYAAGLIKANPFNRIAGTTNTKRLPSVLSESEVEALMNIEVKDYESALAKALFNMFYSTGCRLSEVIGMNRSDVDLGQLRIIVRGKGSKERFVFLSRGALMALDEYSKWRKTIKITDNEPVFLSEKGIRLSSDKVHSIFAKYRVEMGLATKFSPHVFRHSFATHMLDHGSGIRVVQEMLGHSSLSTTQIYAHVSTERLRAVYSVAHPHAHMKEED